MNSSDMKKILLIFLVLEAAAFIIGSLFGWAICYSCIAGEYCPPCEFGNMSMEFAAIGILPNLLIAYVVWRFSFRRRKGKDSGL